MAGIAGVDGDQFASIVMNGDMATFAASNGGSAIDLNATGATGIGRIGQARQHDTASPDSTFARTNGATANRGASIAA